VLPEAKDAGHYLKFGKGLFQAVGENFNRVVGQELEIIPQNNPFKLKPGEKLAVKVVFGDKPLAGVGVEIGDGKTKMKEEDIPRYQTDRDGIAELPIDHRGLQLIAIDYKTPPTHPDLADHDDFSASLVFVIPE
jgi:nickel transport protein